MIHFKRNLKSFIITSLFAAISMFGFGQIIPAADWSHSLNKTTINVGDEVEVIFKTKIPDTYHIYSNDYKCTGPMGGPLPAVFNYKTNNSFKLVGLAKPIGAKKVYDDIFECDITEFHHSGEFRQKIKILNGNPNINGILEYQMCTDAGMCVLHEYEFSIKGLTVNGASAVVETATEVATSETVASSTSTPSGPATSMDSAILQKLQDCCGGKSEVSGYSAYVDKDEVNYAHYKRSGELDTVSCETMKFEGSTGDESQSYFWFFIIAFLSGLAALLTPCVFPMIPMTVSFFMKEESRTKAIRTGLIYGLSIIGIYVLIGTIVAVVAGAAAANWLSTHWIPNIFFFLIFIIFAASFFGAFELVLPSWLVNKVDKQADKGGLIGVFFMAFTIVLVSFSCTGPIVGSILVEAAGGQFVKPLIGMFGFSLAFAIPFTLFAIFPSMLNTLPQSGGWLNTVKVLLGFVELAFGLKFLSVADQTYHWGILDREIYLGLWIVIFTLMGLYLLGKLKFAHDSDTPFVSVPRLFMSIATFAFVVYLSAGLIGAPLKQLAGYLPPMSTHDFNILESHKKNEGHGGVKPKYADKLHLPDGLRGYFDYDQGMEVARQLGMPVFIDFTGHGCVNCREMEARVWSDQRVHDILNDEYVLISLYVDEKTIELPESEWYVARNSGKTITRLDKKNSNIQECMFGSNAQPQYALLDNRGELLQPTRNYNLDKEAYLLFLEKGLVEFKNRVEAERAK